MPRSCEEGRGGACSAPGARRSRSASLQSEWQLPVPCARAAMWVVLFTRTRDRCRETLLTTSAGDARPALSFASERKGESSQQLQVFPLWSGQGKGIRQTIDNLFGVWTPKLKLPTCSCTALNLFCWVCTGQWSSRISSGARCYCLWWT